MSSRAPSQDFNVATSIYFPQLDLHPLYPTPALLSQYLSISSTLTPDERKTLVNHSLQRACTFGDLALLTFLIHDERCNKWIDLEDKDEDGNTMVSICITGFRGNEEGNMERELEREECVRLLIKEGADLSTMDMSGWTPLHHAALFAPTSLISHLISRNASTLALSRRKLTPLDVITAYENVPGREDAIIMLREAMRNALTYEEKEKLLQQGWRGDERREIERRRQERKEKRQHRRKRLNEDVTAVLEEELGQSSWCWGDSDSSTDDDIFEPNDLDDEDDEGYDSDTLLTPRESYSTMLVFSPHALGRILQALIPFPTSQPHHRKLRNPLPAQALYLHCRFAYIACDHNWLEDLIVGAMDRVEEVVMVKPDDLSSLTHWLFNVTLLLHLLRCDDSTAQVCEILGLFGLIEELVNVIYVLIIRIIERRMDPLIDSTLLDYTPPELQTECDAIQFEGEWDGWTGLLGRVMSPKKKPPASGAKTPGRANQPGSGGMSASNSASSLNSNRRLSSASTAPKPTSSKLNPSHTRRDSAPSSSVGKQITSTSSLSRPSSPPVAGNGLPSSSGTISTIRNTINRAAGGTITPSTSGFLTPSDSLTNVAASASGKTTPNNGPTPSTSMVNLTGKKNKPPGPSPGDLTTLLTALHTFMSLSGINPVLIIQTFSQVMYWTACEMFNRILQRRKYICRSRALYIGLNLSVLEEWISGGMGVGLPREVGGHFKVVRELITWLQCLSSIDQFPSLIATVQTFRQLNPLQMRRAVRDYRFEVGESHMTEECTQYLAQLQKDWERQRVKMGVEALKKEMGEREGSVSSRGGTNDPSTPPQGQSIPASASSDAIAQQAIDNLFSRTFEKSEWQPAKPPAVLGELLDARHMLPLLLPSDPVYLGALPVLPRDRNGRRESGLRDFLSLAPDSFLQSGNLASKSRSHSRSGSQAGSRGTSIISVGNKGPMEWLSRSRKLRVVDKEMLKFLGDDEVASELEAIAAKWRHAWDNTADLQLPTIVEDGSVRVVEPDEDESQGEMEYPVTNPLVLTHEPPRILKEMRRRASQVDDG
ncbi:hypothetical protein FRC17_010140 [Serendipita sp. 399]|nr:hypothetical protein FRC17_010140 [Serendipita sp. 399]